MESVIAVFRSRTETLSFVSILKSYKIKVFVINTPRKANVSCGISAQFESANLPLAQNIVSRRNFVSFAGFFRATIGSGREINVVPI